MSMVLTTRIRSTRRPNPWYASALGRFVQQRRTELGMTIAEAAELSGLELSYWAALEAGWVPQHENMLCSIAETLEVMDAQITLLALIARNNQSLVA
jgi:transcriptional regulator with XRE-family HTH domain